MNQIQYLDDTRRTFDRPQSSSFWKRLLIFIFCLIILPCLKLIIPNELIPPAWRKLCEEDGCCESCKSGKQDCRDGNDARYGNDASLQAVRLLPAQENILGVATFAFLFERIILPCVRLVTPGDSLPLEWQKLREEDSFKLRSAAAQHYRDCSIYTSSNREPCLKCLEYLAGFSPVFDWKPVTMELLKGLIAVFIAAAIGIWGMIHALGMFCIAIWFVGPNLTPQQKRRLEIEKARKEQEQREWEHQRDQRDKQRQEEQDKWEQERDERERRRLDEQYQWEQERQSGWERERDELARERDKAQREWEQQRDEHEKASRKEREERERREEQSRMDEVANQIRLNNQLVDELNTTPVYFNDESDLKVDDNIVREANHLAETPANAKSPEDLAKAALERSKVLNSARRERKNNAFETEDAADDDLSRGPKRR